MQRSILLLGAIVLTVTFGCQPDAAKVNTTVTEVASSSAGAGDRGGPMGPGEYSRGGPGGAFPGYGRGGETADASVSVTVPVEAGVASISSDNTKLRFVGTKPDGTKHTGGFATFTSQVGIDEDSRVVNRLNVEFQTASIFADVERLTTHLKSADFFNVREHPTASFASTEIKLTNSEAGEYSVAGSLTMLGVTEEITFPAIANFENNSLQFEGTFEIDRTQFGMTYGKGQIDAIVAISVVVGVTGAPARPSGGFGGRGGGPGGGGRGGGSRGGGGRGGFDPAAMFAQWDADGDGKLAGEEIPERMRERVDAIDTDKDGAVTLEEFQAGMQQRRGQRGGRGGGPGGGGPGGGGPGGSGPGGSGPGGGRGGSDSGRPQRPPADQ